MNHRLCSRNAWSLLAGLSVALAAAQGCKKKDDADTYGLGPDQDGDGWPYELDCDDHDDTVFPAADDVPGDGIDQDCSGSDGKAVGQGGDGNEPKGSGGAGGEASGSGGKDAGSGGGAEMTDEDGDGFAPFPDGDDCDDTRREVFPGAIEIVLNGIDENCDGSDLVGTLESISVLPDGAVLGEVPDLAWGEVDGEPHLLMIWADSRVAPRQDVYAQLFDTSGNPVGDEIAVEDTDNNAKAGVRIVSKGNGFLATWATAEGVFAQQLNARGEKRGILFGLGDPGAQKPIPAYGGDGTAQGGAWAVAWVRPGDPAGNQAKLRGMSTDVAAIRAPVQTLGGAADAIGGVALTGYDKGFVVAWEGPLSEGRGIVAQDASRIGQLRGESFPIYVGAAASPTIASDAGDFFAAFRVAETFGYAGAQIFSSLDGVEEPDIAVRLSSESGAQGGFRVAPTSTGFFALWNDGRHFGHTPSVQAVYGNQWASGEVLSSAGQAHYAASNVELGGLAVIDDFAYFVVKSGEEARLVTHAVK